MLDYKDEAKKHHRDKDNTDDKDRNADPFNDGKSMAVPLTLTLRDSTSRGAA